MKILIDPGHGVFTPGKRSPDGEFREGIYTREIARRIVADLKDRNYDAELLVPEEDDISLAVGSGRTIQMEIRTLRRASTFFARPSALPSSLSRSIWITGQT